MLTKHSCNIAGSNRIALHAITNLTTENTESKFLQKQCLLRALKAFKLDEITARNHNNTANINNNYNKTTNYYSYCPSRSIRSIKKHKFIRNYHHHQQQVHAIVVGNYYNKRVKVDKVSWLLGDADDDDDDEQMKLKN